MHATQQLMVPGSLPVPGGVQGSVQKVLSFSAAGETYAVPIDVVKEILEFGSVTRIPMTPPHVRGVLNLRGSVVPVIDLAVRLGRRRSAVGKRSCIVVLSVQSEDESMNVGVVVDAVNEVLDVAADDLEPAPGFGLSVRPDFIAAMAKVRGRFVTILAPANTFSIAELSELIGGGAAAHAV